MAKSKIQQLLNDVPSGLLVKFTTLNDLYGSNLKKLYPIAPETVATPDVMQLPPFRPVWEKIRGETYSTPEIYTALLENVLYWGAQQEILLSESRQVIAESCMHACLPNERFHLDYGDLRRVKTPEKISGYCSLFRNRRTWAHTLIHNIPRCYLLNQPEYAELGEIKLLCSGSISASEQFFIKKLVPPNVTITPVSKGQLYHIEKLIFPSFLSPPSSGYLPSDYLEKFRAEFLPKRPSKKNRRIYISRAKSAGTTKGRHILNEAELFEKLSHLGFEKCTPEDLSIAEQIELFYDAEIVVGAHGAALTNLLFSEKTKVLELYPMSKELRPFFYYLSKSLGHTHRFWYGNSSEFFANFTVNIPEVLELVNSF